MTCEYEPWKFKSDLLKIDECHLYDDIKKQCLKNEDCPRPWLKEVKDGNP